MNHTIPTETTKLQREVIRLREIIASYEAARKLHLEEDAAAQPAAPAVECGNCFEGKSDMDHVCCKCGGSSLAPAVDAAKLDDLGKLKALAEAAKEQRSALYMAAIDCGHSITDGRIILHLDARKEGNALSQLADRLEEAAAPLAALVAQQAARIAALESMTVTLANGNAASYERIERALNYFDSVEKFTTQEGK